MAATRQAMEITCLLPEDIFLQNFSHTEIRPNYSQPQIASEGLHIPFCCSAVPWSISLFSWSQLTAHTPVLMYREQKKVQGKGDLLCKLHTSFPLTYPWWELNYKSKRSHKQQWETPHVAGNYVPRKKENPDCGRGTISSLHHIIYVIFIVFSYLSILSYKFLFIIGYFTKFNSVKKIIRVLDIKKMNLFVMGPLLGISDLAASGIYYNCKETRKIWGSLISKNKQVAKLSRSTRNSSSMIM